MDVLIDTHVLVWVIQGSSRLSDAARAAITDDANMLAVSAVTAWEFADLHQRGRLPVEASFDFVRDQLALRLLDVPGDLWMLAAGLPDLHRDPIDRMVIAHAIRADHTLLTADATMRRYPVATLW